MRTIKNYIYAASIDGAMELERKILGKQYPFEDCTGDVDFEFKNAPGGGKVYKVSYYRIDEEE